MVKGSEISPDHQDLENGSERENGSPIGLVVIAALLALLGVTSGISGVIVVVSLIMVLFLHELAHFVAAKKTGMKVTEFFLGFGPKIWSFRKGETEYGIKGFPAGAYVRVIGMNNLDPVEPEEERRAYRNAKFYQRVLLASAGSLMHFFLALILLYVVLVGNGIQIDDSDWTVRETLADGPAEQMGIEAGDKIVAINEAPVENWLEFAATVASSPNQTVSIEVQRDGETYVLEGQIGTYENIDASQVNQKGFIGIARSQFRNIEEGPVDAIFETGKEFGYLTRETISGLGKFFSPAGLRDFFSDAFSIESTTTEGEGSAIANVDDGRIVSVVGATRIGAQLTETGWPGLLLFLATINVFIGFFNLIPLLPLDGGHIAVATYEQIRSRRGERYHADVSKLLPLTYIVIFVLIAVGLAAIYLDIADPISL